MNFVFNYILLYLRKSIIAENKEHLKSLINKEIQLNGKICNLNHIDVSNITDMSDLFSYSEFNGYISQWNTSNVVNMRLLFYNSEFNNDISNWNVINVQHMKVMFFDFPSPHPWWYIEDNDLRKEIITKKILKMN